MNNTWIMGGVVAGIVATGGIVGTVSAQTAALQTGLTEEQIIAIALEEVPGTVSEIDLEREDGLWIYEVEVLGADGVETELEIGAETGDILEVAAETDDDDDDDEHGKRGCDKAKEDAA